MDMDLWKRSLGLRMRGLDLTKRRLDLTKRRLTPKGKPWDLKFARPLAYGVFRSRISWCWLLLVVNIL